MFAKTLTAKILDAHIISGSNSAGHEVAVKIDQTLTQDATGTMAYLQFEATGTPRVQTELSVSYVDHNTIQIGFENADDHKYLQTVAARYGIYYSRPGNGICHQVHLERFGRPGRILLGSDSHTPTGGGIGMLAIGAGGLDVAMAMSGAPFYMNYPEVVLINLTGKLGKWVGAKDVILKVLEKFGTKGNVGVIAEYGGPGVKTLTVPERATITNMGAECGFTTSVFPSDALTKAFLKAQGREKQWKALSADAGAVYSRTVEIDLSAIEPMTAKPHSPGNIARVKDMLGIKVDQVCMGSCTNSSFRDMMIFASLLKGRTIHPDVSVVVAPGSKQVVEMLSDNGMLSEMLKAGVRLSENACGFCIGNSQSPASGAVSLRTGNRNFLGRSGTKDANVYIVGPETAAASALTGRFTDPRDLEKLKIRYPVVKMPSKFKVNDNMIIPPPKKGANVTVVRGPNIGEPPAGTPMSDVIEARAAIKLGDEITTDHIIPAGARMKYRSNIAKYSEFLFEVVDPEFAKRALANKAEGKWNVIVAGASYGQGSSREHAALCPMYVGVKAVLAKSFERIHSANLVNFGIMPLVFRDPKDYDSIEQGDELRMESIHASIRQGADIRMKNVTKASDIFLKHAFTARQVEMLLAGGALKLKKNGK